MTRSSNTAADAIANAPVEQSRPIPVRRRHDLQIAATGTQSHPLWTVKDPLSNRYFQLRAADYFVFCQLDGAATIEQIQQRFYASHAPRMLSEEQILSFVQRLWSQGLITAERFGMSEAISQRATRMRSAERKQKMMSWLAIRFRGIDPDRFLTACLPAVNWLFSPVAVMLSVLLMLIAAVIVGSEWETLRRELPTFQAFLTSGHLIWFLLTLAAVKVFHELAHAFACKRFGGECHELGVMLLALTPCLYCNVSDAWLLPRRWHRIAISGAGIYAEVVIASLCTLLWSVTVPGVVHTTCLYMMVISSVNTLLLNGNPLLRYDGYYILADAIGVPNLRSRSQALVQSWLTRRYFGIQSPDALREQPVSRRLVGIYGLLSSVYMWFVLLAILWMLYQFAKPYGLQQLVVAFGIVTVGMRAFAAIRKFVRFCRHLFENGLLQVTRLTLSVAVSVIGLVALLQLPIPRRASAPLTIESDRSSGVFVSSPGQLERVELDVGTHVAEQTVLARLKNRDLEKDVLKLAGQVAQQEKTIELLLARQARDPEASSQLPTAMSTLEDSRRQLQRKQDDLSRLILRAPHAGRILPPQSQPQSHSTDPALTMHGHPAEPMNSGAWLEAGTEVCRIVETERYEARLFCEQADVAVIAPGHTARIVTGQTPHSCLRGTVTAVSSEPMTQVPPNVASLQLIPVQAGENGQLLPARPMHEIRVAIDNVEHVDLAFGQTGQAVIELEREPIYAWILRSVRQTLTFEL